MRSLYFLAFFFLILLIVGFYSSRKTTSYQSYALGYRRYPWWIIMATLSASFLGGGYTMGVSTKTITVGIGAIIGMFGFSVKELIVGKWIAPHIASDKSVLTLGDMMGKHYGKKAQVITGLLGVFVSVGVLGVQLSAMGYVIQTFFGLSHSVGVIVGSCVIVVYTLLGGLSAIVLTDVLQFIVLIIGIPLTLFFGLQAVDMAQFNMLLEAQWQSLGTSETIVLSISLFLTFLLGETFVPPYIQRLLIGTSSKDTVKGTLGSGLLSIPFFIISGLIGLVAISLNASVSPDLAMPFVIQTYLPAGIKMVVMLGVISAVMSTADSFLHSGAIVVERDIYEPLCQTQPARNALLLKVVVLIMACLSVIAAISVPSLIDLCIISWTFWSPMMLPAAFMLLIGRPVAKRVMFSGMAIGAVTTILWSIFNPDAVLAALVVGVFSHVIWYGFCRFKQC